MEGFVKVRRKLFFYKRRQMFLMEDGKVLIVKNGHISNEMVLNKHAEIAHQCDGSADSCKFLISTPSTYEYVDCESSDLASTWVHILLNIRKMTIDGSRKKRPSKAPISAASKPL
jgi:hypothetical protein